MEKSRLSARQKDRNSGIILSYKSTKKATFFLLKKARRCARVPSDMSSSICRSPELASVSRYRLAAAPWPLQRIHALSYDWRDLLPERSGIGFALSLPCPKRPQVACT